MIYRKMMVLGKSNALPTYYGLRVELHLSLSAFCPWGPRGVTSVDITIYLTFYCFFLERRDEVFGEGDAYLLSAPLFHHPFEPPS